MTLIFATSLSARVDEDVIAGVDVYRSPLYFPLLLVGIGFSIYLIALQPNWMKALQILIWIMAARGIIFFIINVFAFIDATPVSASPLSALLSFVWFVVVEPLGGFVFIGPAFYVWIRTRKRNATQTIQNDWNR